MPSGLRLLDIEGFTTELDKRLWNHCFDKLGVFTVMNSKNIEKIRKEIEQKPPLLTQEIVESTINRLYEDRKKYFVEGIIDTFQRLSSDHKTNTNEKFKIPDKCVIKYMLEPSWSQSNHLRINYSNENRLEDIQRTFCVLDKKEFQQRQTVCEINAKLKEGNVYENEYFHLQGYKNGNIHIAFKRIDLLDAANQLIADYYGNVLK